MAGGGTAPSMKMSDVFFNQLKFPRPDIHLSLEKKTKSGDVDDKMYVNNGEYLKDKDAVIQELMTYDGDLGQLGEIRDKLKVEFEKCNPDLVVVFGDVTSTLAAGLASKILNIDLTNIKLRKNTLCDLIKIDLIKKELSERKKNSNFAIHLV